MDVLESLATALKQDYPRLGNFPVVKSLLKKAQEGRNRTAHGQWAYEDGSVYKLRATARGKLKADIIPISLPEIETIIGDIGKAGRAVLQLVFNV